MDRLWAPWRRAYLEVAAPAGCIFCDQPAAERDEEHGILYRGQWGFVILNAFPYNSGHLMVAPFRHTADLESLTAAEQAEIFDLTRLSVSLLRSAYRPDGYNIGMNLGRVAGAGVADHLHMHVVPRWNGDTNFMPVIAETKVLSESLTDTWRKLREALRAREGDTSGGGRAP